MAASMSTPPSADQNRGPDDQYVEGILHPPFAYKADEWFGAAFVCRREDFNPCFIHLLHLSHKIWITVPLLTPPPVGLAKSIESGNSSDFTVNGSRRRHTRSIESDDDSDQMNNGSHTSKSRSGNNRPNPFT